MSAEVTLRGRLAEDPVALKDGMRFTVITKRRVQKDGAWTDDEVTAWDCRAWGKLAMNMASSELAQGDNVIVQGRASGKDHQVAVMDLAVSLKWDSARVEKAR